MQPAWLSEVVGVAGAIGGGVAGGVLGWRGAARVSRRERDDASIDHIRRTYAAYLGAVYASVAQLHDLPPAAQPAPLVRVLNRLRGESATWVATQRSIRMTVGNEHKELARRVVDQVANLQVLAIPEQMRTAVDETNDYLIRLGKQRSPEIKAEWSGIQARLVTAAQSLDG